MGRALLLDVLAAIIIGTAVVNLYFVGHGAKLYFSSSRRSPILLAFLVVKVAVWLAGCFAGLVAWRVLFDLEPLPFGGLLLGGILVVIGFLPAFIHLTMRRVAGFEEARDTARDTDRDAGRDPARDAVRDPARDAERDPARDAERDAEQDA